MSKGICSGCKEVFNSVSVFDAHRYGTFGDPIYQQARNGTSKHIIGYTEPDRQCLTDIQMYTKGLMKNDRGWWVGSLYDPSAHGSDENERNDYLGHGLGDLRQLRGTDG